MNKNLLKRYPYKRHIYKVVSDNYMNSSSCKEFLKERGILVFGHGKNELAALNSEFYFDRKDFIEFKDFIIKKDVKLKSTSRNFKKNKLENVKEALFKNNNKIIDESLDMKLTNLDMSDDNNITFSIDYLEIKPGRIDLLDEIPKSIPVRIVSTPDGNLAFDFSYTSSSEASKIIKALELLSGEDNKFEMTPISLCDLQFNEKIELFDRFFTYEHEDFIIEEIKGLKIKKNPKISQEEDQKLVTEHDLKGINSAILEGENLRENQFVKSVLQSNYYFSMAKLRFHSINNKIDENKKYFDLCIEFRTNTEYLQLSIEDSGEYEKDSNDNIEEIKKEFKSSLKEDLLNNYKKIIFEIYIYILNRKNIIDITEVTE